MVIIKRCYYGGAQVKEDGQPLTRRKADDLFLRQIFPTTNSYVPAKIFGRRTFRSGSKQQAEAAANKAIH